MSDTSELASYCLQTAEKAKAASRLLAAVDGQKKNDWIALCAKMLTDRRAELLAANAEDLKAAESNGLSPAMIDRLRLTDKTLDSMATALSEIASFPDPVGRILTSSIRPSGLEVRKVSVPLGVVFFIYESRPNVTTDAAAICVKSGNAVILRGGKEAIHSNLALGKILADAAEQTGLPRDAVQLVSTTDRDAVDQFLSMPQYIDVTIPRGGEGLIRRVSDNARMPVIKHFNGNCHVYIDRFADEQTALAVVVNSKCQRLGTCNTAESLVIHSEAAPTLWPKIAAALIERGVEIRGDARLRSLTPQIKPAEEDDYDREYLAAIISAKMVDSLDEAIDHINNHSSHHTEAIITRDLNASRQFTTRIDSSAVMVNASTRLNDGGVFGLGAEIGISTDKFHARGPCGINELTSYKYVVIGEAHLRQ
ncbi:MAG: glutamate-5-semialdehyde dehydrogenase [Thermoguttaceae bacterium]|nr:glutamate-5-semialdehyde dehydrogenase [Thermoguttaceae bacterium]